jgi:hypothetical protein
MQYAHQSTDLFHSTASEVSIHLLDDHIEWLTTSTGLWNKMNFYLKNAVFWGVMLCSLAEIYQCFRRLSYLYLQDWDRKFFWNAGKCLASFTALHPRRQYPYSQCLKYLKHRIFLLVYFNSKWMKKVVKYVTTRLQKRKHTLKSSYRY